MKTRLERLLQCRYLVIHLIVLGTTVWIVQHAVAADFSSSDDLLRLLAECKGYIQNQQFDKATKVSQQLTASLWARESFQVANFSPVTRLPHSFGDIEKREQKTYRVDETLLFYAEPRHFDFRQEGGNFSYAVSIDVEIRSSDGRVLDSKKDIVRRAQMHAEPVYSLYTPLEVALRGIPGGSYDVVFTFKDLISSRETSVTERVTIQ